MGSRETPLKTEKRSTLEFICPKEVPEGDPGFMCSQWLTFENANVQEMKQTVDQLTGNGAH